jgi:hypothetical protein
MRCRRFAATKDQSPPYELIGIAQRARLVRCDGRLVLGSSRDSIVVLHSAMAHHDRFSRWGAGAASSPRLLQNARGDRNRTHWLALFSREETCESATSRRDVYTGSLLRHVGDGTSSFATSLRARNG